MKYLIILLIFCGCDNHDETELFNTICIDGIKHLSVVTKYDCNYIPLEIDGQYVRCKE